MWHERDISTVEDMKTVTSRTRHALVAILAVALLAAGCSTTLVGRPMAGPQPVGAPGEADGAVPDGTRLTVFDQRPAVTELDPDLLAALQDAAAEADAAGVGLRINSGWRSRAYQQWLLDEAVAEYGSYEEARRWVATPEVSHHISGDAVDVGPPDAAAWLESHGSRWGLCRVYANEPWHFELVGTGGTCPALVADASG